MSKIPITRVFKVSFSIIWILGIWGLLGIGFYWEREIGNKKGDLG